MQTEHDKNLILFLETVWKNGLKLNKEKLQFNKKEVPSDIYGAVKALVQIQRILIL